jgi:hypothetical protein
MPRWPLPVLLISACSARHDPRNISADATYAELVASISEIKDPEAGSGCLFTRTEDGIRFTGHVATGDATLAPPRADWNAEIEARGRIAFRTNLGFVGSEQAAFEVTALVPVPRDNLGSSQNTVLHITDEGAWLGTMQHGTPVRGAAPLTDELAATYKKHIFPKQTAPLIVVAVEAGVPVTALVDALEPFSSVPAVFMLITEASDAPRPERGTPNRSLTTQESCARGFDPAEGAQGKHPMSQAGGFFATATDALTEACGADLPWTGGGSLELMLRVDAEGTVTEGCVNRAAEYPNTLVTCALAAARAMDLPALSSGTHAIVQTTATIRPHATLQVPVCAAEE